MDSNNDMTPAPKPRPGKVPPTPLGSSARRTRRARKAVEPRGPASLVRAGATTLVPPDGDAPTTTPSPGLTSLAMSINRSHRRFGLDVSNALRHARRAGEELIGVKAGLAHGKFQAWVRENCEFKYRRAAFYMEVCRRWPEFEESYSAKVRSDAHFTLSGLLKGLAKPRVGSASDGDPRAVEAGDRPRPGAIGVSPTGPGSPPPPERADGPIADDPADLSHGDGRGVGGSISGVVHPEKGGPTPPAPGGEATPGEVGEDDDRGARPADPATGDAPAGVFITDESRRRDGDVIFLFKHCPIRPELDRLGNTRDFDADATAWRVLRPIAEEILAREGLAGGGYGRHAPAVVDFLLARSPSEWELCPGCGGAGRLEPGEEPCPVCSGGGYLIPA